VGTDQARLRARNTSAGSGARELAGREGAPGADRRVLPRDRWTDDGLVSSKAGGAGSAGRLLGRCADARLVAEPVEVLRTHRDRDRAEKVGVQL
jgi:hypothetical protein